MFVPGTIGATADCDTCGDKGTPTVTRIATQNMEKLNNPIKPAKLPVTKDEGVEIAKQMRKALEPTPRGRKKKEVEPIEDQLEQTEEESND